MNKILKFGKPYTLGFIKELLLVGLFTLGIGILNICNATTIEELIELNCATYLQEENLCGRDSFSSGTGYYFERTITSQQPNYVELFDYSTFIPYSGAGTYCINIIRNGGGNAQTLTMGFANGGTTTPSNLYTLYNDQYGKRVCLYGNKPHFNVKGSTNTETRIIAKVFKLENFLEKTLSGYILESNINTAYCTGNNLCPTCEQCEQCEECQQCQTCPTIDAQYCMNNFNLIPPAYCPICGTGDINWSSLYINGIQYNSNEIIDIHTEDQMQTNIDYLNDTVDIDITYGQDENYLNAILSGTAMTPTKEDFATMLTDGMIAYAPYLFIGLLMIFTIGLIKKFFRG